jgi:hypothetical protein
MFLAVRNRNRKISVSTMFGRFRRCDCGTAREQIMTPRGKARCSASKPQRGAVAALPACCSYLHSRRRRIRL